MANGRWTAYGLFLIALGLAVNSVLGPMALEVIEFRFSESLINQGIGLDFVSLVVAAPIATMAGILVLRGHPMGMPLALGPASYTAYMSVQYAIGPEYVGIEGNSEQFFPLYLGLFIVAVLVLVSAWRAMPDGTGDGLTPRARRSCGVILLAAGAMLLLRYLPGLAEMVGGDPDFTEYSENATSFLLITWMDLGIFMPLMIATGIGMISRASWAPAAAYGVLGWLALTGMAVAAMAVVMEIRDGPDASIAAVVGFSVVAAISTGLWATFHVKMFTRDRKTASHDDRNAESAGQVGSPLPH